MVSDTLDVAEIFFNIDKFNGKVEIIKWDWSIMLTELDQSGISGHRYFADASVSICPQTPKRTTSKH